MRTGEGRCSTTGVKLQWKRSGRTYDSNNEYRDTNGNIESKENEQQSVNLTFTYSHLQSQSIKKCSAAARMSLHIRRI